MYCKKAQTPGFEANAPSLLPIRYYPLRIMAAEWISYIEAMRTSIKRHEYSNDKSAHGQNLATLDSDLRSLQIWDRRFMKTTHKLHSVIKFVETRI